MTHTHDSKEKVYAERLNKSKTDREEIVKDAIKENEKDKPEEVHKSRKFKYTKKDTLL